MPPPAFPGRSRLTPYAGEVQVAPEQVHIQPAAPNQSARQVDHRRLAQPADPAALPAAVLDLPASLEYASGCQRSHSRVLGAAVRQPFAVASAARALPGGGLALQCTLTSNMAVPASLAKLVRSTGGQGWLLPIAAVCLAAQKVSALSTSTGMSAYRAVAFPSYPPLCRPWSRSQASPWPPTCWTAWVPCQPACQLLVASLPPSCCRQMLLLPPSMPCCPPSWRHRRLLWSTASTAGNSAAWQQCHWAQWVPLHGAPPMAAAPPQRQRLRAWSKPLRQML